MKVNLKLIFFVLISFIGISHSFAQTLGEIEKNADVLFESGEYIEAGKLYLKVISDRERIKDHTLNFKYGTCLLYNTGEKKQEAIGYLKRAVKNPSIDVRAHYYLGKAYHYNYQFDLAQKSYEKFEKQASTGEKKKYNVAADIKACKNGKKLLSDITDMIVIKKTQIKKDNFYELYKLENIGGSILRYDEFQTKYDKKVGHIPLIHFPKASPFIYFSSYGENGATGLDIYVVKKLPNNEWSLAQKVMGGVNTFQDEDFPYMSPDGRFLYFSSKGHNSMGGYDVFRSRYSSGDNSFMTPDNMDFAISSPDDDLFYIVDSLDRNAYFTSARESELGKLTVYQARVEKIPMQMAVIKGEFINTLDESNKNIEIVVSNYSNGKEIGTFKSNSKKGSYLITFPKSGKYTFIMTVDGQELSHQAVINIPYLKEFRPLKMTISHLTDVVNGNYIKVEQKFDEKFENPTAIMSEIFKELSKLKPNAAKFDLDSLDRLGKVNELFVEAGLDPYSTKLDVEKVAEDKIIDLEKIYEENDNNSTVAYHLAEEKLNVSNETLEEIKILVTEASNETDEVKKNAILQSVYSKNEKAKQQKKEASHYLELAQEIDNDNNTIQGEIIKAKKLLLDVKSVDDADRVALGNLIYSETAFFDEHVKKGAKITKSEEIITNGTSVIKEISKINAELVRLNSDINRLKDENGNAQTNSEATSKKKLKEKYLQTIAENESEIEMLTHEVKLNKTQIDKLSDSGENIELTKLAREINDPAYAIKAYTTKIHPNDKAKLQSQLNESNSDYVQIDKVLDDNNIKGKMVSLTGLNENRSDFTPAEWGVAIDEEIKAQERKLYESTNPNEIDQIKGEIVRLNTLKDEKTNTGESQPALAAKNNILNEFELEATKLNAISDDTERQIAQNTLLEETIIKVESELVGLKAELARNPSNSEVSTRIEELELLNAELSSKVVAKEVDYSEVSTRVNLDNMYPNFNEESTKIENSSLSDKEKSAGQLVLNNKLISNIDTEVESLRAYKATKPVNISDIQERIDALNKVKSEKLDENTALKVVSGADTVNPNFLNLETDVTERDIMPDYESRQVVIENSKANENNKANENIKLNLELVSKIDIENEALKTYLNSGPINQKDVEIRIDNLDKLKLSVLKDNEGHQSILDSTSDINIAGTASIETINSNFETKQLQINSIVNSNQRIIAQNELNEETIDVIEIQILALESKLKNDESNEIIPNQIEELAQLKDNLKSNIDTNVVDLSIISATVQISDLLPNYHAEKTAIGNSKANETVKSIRYAALNDLLISKIDTELSTLNSYLSSNPANKKDIEKRIKNIEKLKSSIVKENEDYQIVIANSDGTVENADILSIDKIISNFESKQAENNSIEDTKEKTLAQNQLIENTVTLIDNQVSELESRLEKDLTNEIIASQIEEFSKLKANLNSQIDRDNMNYSNISATVAIGDLLPNYYIEKEAIDNSKANETIKATKSIALNIELISKVDVELASLKTYLNSDPANKKEVEKRIENLAKLKTTVVLENESYQAVIDSEPKLLTGTITVGDLIPGFIEKVEVIENSDVTASDKAIAKNELNAELIDKIELKLVDLKYLKENNPNQLKEINEQIETLTQLRFNTLKEIEINDNNIISTDGLHASNQPKSALISDLSESDFTTPEGKEKVQDLEGELMLLNEINTDLKELEVLRESETSEKSIKKIDKKITKNKVKQAAVENKIIEELASVNTVELLTKQAEIVSLKVNSNSIDEDILNANKQLEKSNVKIEKAKQLRAEAEESNDLIEANKKYKAAILLENEAKVEMDETIVVYQTAVVFTSLNPKNGVITSVDENTENRQSTLLFTKANEIEKQANYYENRANILRDSAETVKKKYKDAILIDVQSNENKANELRTKAFEIKEKATLLKVQEDELINSIPTGTLVTVEGEEKEKTLQTDAYKFYFEEKSSADKDMVKAKSLEDKIQVLKLKAKRKIKMAIVVGGDVSSISNDDEIKIIQAEIDALREEQEGYKASAIQKYNAASAKLNDSKLSDDTKHNIIALSVAKEQPKEKVGTNSNPLLADFKAPEKLDREIFRTTDVPVYASTKDIPVDALQPSGLTYKVQIGAFRNEPDKKYFDKFAPVSGQSLDNGITRYMVGYFTNFNPANSVKKKIRGMGDYKDAFVVAYYNGERISIAKARALELENEIPITEYVENTQVNTVIEPNNVATNEAVNTVEVTPDTQTPVTDKTINVIPISESDKVKTSYYTDSPNAAKANQVEIMNGLFFTVQIGVYSKPVEPAALFNTNPLNSQLTPSNKIRYTTGIFNSVAEASVRKSEVVASGIPDAFVTAYYDGKRITITNAKEILKENGPSVLFSNKMPSNQESNIINEKTIDYNKEYIHYRILIGKFEGEVPREFAGYLFNTEGIIFETETDFEGHIFLLTTKQLTIGAVKQHLFELSELGIEDMHLISYYNIDVIEYEVAQNITNNKQFSEYVALDETEGISADFLLYEPEAIYYQIEIAEFEEHVPVDIATIILELDPDLYEEVTNEFGYSTYYSNKLESYDMAMVKLNDYKEKGFKEARVIAIHKYQEISVDKAKAIKGK